MLEWILPLFTPSFWFNVRPVPFMPWLERFLPFFMGVLVLAGIVGFLYARAANVDKDERRFLKGAAACLGWAGAVGWVLLFFHLQAVPYLSMRVLWLCWLAGFGAWGYLVWKERFRTIPALRAADRDRAAYEKWLPKPKGRK